MVILASRRDMQIALHGCAERLEKVFEHLCRGVSHIFPCKIHIPFEIHPTSKIHQHHGLRLIHRQGETVPLNALPVTQGFQQDFPEGDGHILHRVMLVHIQITFGLDFQ